MSRYNEIKIFLSFRFNASVYMCLRRLQVKAGTTSMLCQLSKCWPSIETVLAEFLVSTGVLVSTTCVLDAGVIIYKYHTLANPSKIGLYIGGLLTGRPNCSIGLFWWSYITLFSPSGHSGDVTAFHRIDISRGQPFNRQGVGEGDGVF